jgi:hypothetical protein
MKLERIINNFLRLVNPNQVYLNDNILTWNSGIYGSDTDNGFPDLIEDLYTNYSSVNQNLINLKANLITGNNLQSASGDTAADAFLATRNKAGDNIKAVYAKEAPDLSKLNISVKQVIWSKDGTKIIAAYYVPVRKFRYGKPNKYGQIEYGYIADNWAMINNKKNYSRSTKGVQICMFDPAKAVSNPNQLMVTSTPCSTYYPVPSYSACIPELFERRAISEYHLNNVKTNWFIGGKLTIVRAGRTDEQVRDYVNELMRDYMGENGYHILVDAVENLDQASKFESFAPADLSKMFETRIPQIDQSIVSAHGAYTILAGLDSMAKGADLGGDSNRLKVAIEAFQKFQCEPMKDLLVASYNRIAEINGFGSFEVSTDPLGLIDTVNKTNENIPNS